MADRTLRRTYTNPDGDTGTIPRGNGESEGAVESVRIVEREPDSDGASAIVGESIDGAERAVPGVTGNGYVEIDPADLGKFIDSGGTTGIDTGSGTGKRRGRKPGSTNKRRGKEAPPNLDTLILMHTMASVMLHTPELMIDKDEAKALSDALANVQQYIDIPLISPKTMAFVNLAGTMAMMYGTRFVAIGKRRKAERLKAKETNQQSNVVCV